jgi:uncharacterized protein
MPQITDTFELGRLQLVAGQGRRLELHARLDALQLSGQEYPVAPDPVPVTLDVARMTGGGWSLRLRFAATPRGPCMRCLQDAGPTFDVDAREINQEGSGEELDSPYVGDDGQLDLRAWARDALALALPAQILCRPDCAGLCPVCGADLNREPGHEHEREPDPRWAKLRELSQGS